MPVSTRSTTNRRVRAASSSTSVATSGTTSTTYDVNGIDSLPHVDCIGPKFLLLPEDEKQQKLTICPKSPAWIKAGRNWRKVFVRAALTVTADCVRNAGKKGALQVLGGDEKKKPLWKSDIPTYSISNLIGLRMVRQSDRLIHLHFMVPRDYRLVFEMNRTSTLEDVETDGQILWKDVLDGRYSLPEGKHTFKVLLRSRSSGIGQLLCHNQPEWSHVIKGDIVFEDIDIPGALYELEGYLTLAPRSLRKVPEVNPARPKQLPPPPPPPPTMRDIFPRGFDFDRLEIVLNRVYPANLPTEYDGTYKKFIMAGLERQEDLDLLNTVRAVVALENGRMRDLN